MIKVLATFNFDRKVGAIKLKRNIMLKIQLVKKVLGFGFCTGLISQW